MPSPSKSLLLALACVCACLALAARLMWSGGVFTPLDPGFAGSCQVIALGGSARDLRVDRERGIAYLSIGGAGTGTVMLLDLNLANPAPRAAMSYDPPSFRPDGISLLQQPRQPARLFAVSDIEGGVPAVEISERDAGGAFIPRQTVRDPAIDRPSQVAAVGPGQFYALNHRPPQGVWRRQMLLLWPAGDDSIAYHDGTKATVMVRGLAWASGMALSPDQSHLYVAEMLTRSLRVYRRDADSAQLVLERTVDVGSPPGNLDVDADGVVWMTAHPKLLRYFAGSDDADTRLPTQVLRFDPRTPDARPVQVFADDGAKISAGATAARWRDELVIGALFDKKVLICKPVP